MPHPAFLHVSLLHTGDATHATIESPPEYSLSGKVFLLDMGEQVMEEQVHDMAALMCAKVWRKEQGRALSGHAVTMVWLETDGVTHPLPWETLLQFLGPFSLASPVVMPYWVFAFSVHPAPAFNEGILSPEREELHAALMQAAGVYDERKELEEVIAPGIGDRTHPARL
jgi:hypothetical protein